MRLVGYVRVSKVAGREGDSFISPDVQRDRIRALAAAGGHEIVEWVEDMDESGGSMRRPGMEHAMELVESGGAQGIAVAKLDRFSRSTLDVELGVRRLEAAGGIFLAADLGMDTSTAGGKLMRTMLAAVAEFQLDRIRETWRDANERAVARGVRGGVPPLGYRRRDDGRFEPDEHAPTVRRVFDDRVAGASWVMIARASGLSTSRVRSLIKSRTYLGEIRVGSAVRIGAHEPLVSRATWEAAQYPAGVSRARRGSLLAGLIRCAGCGNAMTHELGGARKYRGYRCARHLASGHCAAPAKIGAERAERYVVELALGRLAMFEFEPAPPRTSLTDDAERALDAAELELSTYRDSTLATVIGIDAFTEGLRTRQQRVDLARQRLVDAQGDQRIDTIGRRGHLAAWRSLTMLDQHAVLARMIDRVECARAQRSGPGTPVEDRLRIHWAHDPRAGSEHPA